jgi:hypothetical protein
MILPNLNLIEMNNFPHKIIGKLLTSESNCTSQVIVNEKKLEFLWKVTTYYNLLNDTKGLGVEIVIVECKVNNQNITDSYKREFNSNNYTGKMEKTILDITQSKLNNKLNKLFKDTKIEYLEFKFL